MRRSDEAGMSRRGLLAAVTAGVCAGLLAVASPSLAQMVLPVTSPAKALTEDDVAARLAHAGFTDVSQLRRRGAHFTADARARNGMRAKVVIHGVTGDLLGFKLIEEPVTGRLDETDRR